jgi:hypothetical protein
MAAKGKTTNAKATTKAPKPTTVKKPTKVTKTPAKKPRKAPKPKITDEQFYEWFSKQPYNKFVQLTEAWNEDKLKIKLESHDTYDGWLNYFKGLPVSKLQLLSKTGLDVLPAEAYAALSFWRDVMSNPSRISKIHKAGLTRGGKGEQKTITELAAANDRYGVLKAIRDQLADRMQNNPGNRDTADLSKQLTEVMTQIADYERRLAPTKKTKLGELMADIPAGPTAEIGVSSKRPPKDGGGHRRTSFASRVTISDVRGKK